MMSAINPVSKPASKPLTRKRDSQPGPFYKTLQAMWRYRILYIFLAPAVVWFIVFAYVPMFGNVVAFKEYNFRDGIYGSPWVGLKYFKQFLNYYDFNTVFFNTIKIALIKIVIEFPIPIIFALLLNEMHRLRIKKIVQSISYLPYFVSWVIVIQIFNILLSPSDGLVNKALLNIGWLNEPIYFMGEKNYFYPIIVISDLFKGMGWSSIIYLATISGINSETYEAAAIDGASRFKMALHITIPSIIPTAGLLFILGFSGILRSGFDQIYLLQNPGNMGLSETLDTYVFKQGMLSGNISYSSAVGLFQSIVSLVLIVIINKIASKTMELSLW